MTQGKRAPTKSLIVVCLGYYKGSNQYDSTLLSSMTNHSFRMPRACRTATPASLTNSLANFANATHSHQLVPISPRIALRLRRWYTPDMQLLIQRTLLLLALLCSGSAEFFQFVAQFSKSCPVYVQKNVFEARDRILATFFVHEQYKEFKPADPGDTVSVDNVAVETIYRNDNTTASGETVVNTSIDSGLRGNARRLQISQCPKKCANSGSKYCRSLGCAYCGSSCSRRLAEDLKKTAAQDIASAMDFDLMQFSNEGSGCNIWITIFRILDDGSLEIYAE